MSTQVKCSIAIVVSSLVALLGGWSPLLYLLLLMIVIDYITGVLAAWMNHRLDSSIGFRGIARKVIILAIVALAYGIDGVLGSGQWIRDSVVVFYLCNELLSITENSAACGVPMPEKIAEALRLLQKNQKE